MGLIGDDEQQRRRSRDSQSWFASNLMHIITLCVALGGVCVSYGVQKEQMRTIDERVVKIEGNGVPVVRQAIDALKWEVQQHDELLKTVRQNDKDIDRITEENKTRDRDMGEMKQDIKQILKILQDERLRASIPERLK